MSVTGHSTIYTDEQPAVTVNYPADGHCFYLYIHEPGKSYLTAPVSFIIPRGHAKQFGADIMMSLAIAMVATDRGSNLEPDEA